MDQPSHTEEREIDKSIVGRWAYIKELATTNTRGGEIEFIRLYIRGKHSEGWREESIHRQRIREKCNWCSSFLTITVTKEPIPQEVLNG